MNSRVRTFLSYYKPYSRLLIADLVCSIIATLAALALPLCVRYVGKNVLEAGAPTLLAEIYEIGALMLALVIVYMLASMFVNYRGHMMGTLIERNVRADLFAKYQSLSFGFYDTHRTGQLMSRLTNDLENLSELYHHGPEDLVIGLLKFLGATAILFSIDAKLTLVILLFLPVMAVYALYFNRRLNRAIAASRQRIGDINAQVEDTLAGIRVVQSFANEEIEQRKFARENNHFVESRRAVYKNELYFYDGLIAFTQLITVVAVVIGGVSVAQSSLDVADLLTFLLYIGLIIDPIQRITNFARLYQAGIAGFNRFMDIMELTPEIRDAENAISLPRVRGQIEFRKVSFKYKEEYTEVVKDISLEIGAGDYVALVGPSGAGKTTLCSLIPRFYDVTEGEIRLDGLNIRQATLRSLRQNIGVVQQDVYLFAGTVAENIAYGKPGSSPDEIVAAAKLANAHDFIMSLPHGYNTDVGQRGVKLSGGQKQRLSIARVFLKDPPILIFDEATSALDNESERAVHESLDRLSYQRTTIVIAHRLSTIRKAKKIIVLTANGIDEQGTHDTLIMSEGTYSRLYNAHLAEGMA